MLLKIFEFKNTLYKRLYVNYPRKGILTEVWYPL